MGVNGCSSTAVGQEKYEFFKTRRGSNVQYDYRTIDGVCGALLALLSI
ncbi:MAG: DUF3873 family protein [Bacteroidetes bacterium]|nr:DUF3873 family protein [Bacteroidota bacterium]